MALAGDAACRSRDRNPSMEDLAVLVCGVVRLARPLVQRADQRLAHALTCSGSELLDRAGGRLRPSAPRRLSTMRPFLVAIRARKPWARLRLMTLGWNVLFMVHLYISFCRVTAKASEKEAALYRMAGGVAIAPIDLLRRPAQTKVITRYPQAISIFSSSFSP